MQPCVGQQESTCIDCRVHVQISGLMESQLEKAHCGGVSIKALPSCINELGERFTRLLSAESKPRQKERRAVCVIQLLK